MAIAEITVIPIGTATTSLSGYVADMQRTLVSVEGINYEMTAMGTIIEGSIDRLFEAIQRLHECPFQAGAGRVSTVVKIDDRRDQDSSVAQKLESVRAKLKA
ncbi:MTH1187 family thiamine-binding protein [Paenibacillus terrigena]|uniref:MTH1187 family thiamine-binding protein n=1 Tax=Paenibacillus terrigena TaxID=369333 RepID=UPI0028D8E3BB|nr:MTH1187 family thiamine-binding protein [Paenibacillus terrigena]